VDLGPEGGDAGGYVVAQGTPEEVAQVQGSYTGQFLRHILWERTEHSREGNSRKVSKASGGGVR
jgi:excinuclease ABC subunit A